MSMLSVQVDDTEVISFLLQTEIIPLCLRTMEMGSELSKTVCITFLVFSYLNYEKILLDDVGLRYICATAERFFAVGSVLANMVGMWSSAQLSPRDVERRDLQQLSSRNVMTSQLHVLLLQDDPATRRWLQQLLHNVAGGNLVASLQAGGLDHMMGN
ncbi:hypothetical protein BHE74_00052271 [Ensete ventricosum]|nr:hypothetical protein BHE74_00052271 [Ensete ventricosum]